MHIEVCVNFNIDFNIKNFPILKMPMNLEINSSNYLIFLFFAIFSLQTNRRSCIGAWLRADHERRVERFSVRCLLVAIRGHVRLSQSNLPRRSGLGELLLYKNGLPQLWIHCYMGCSLQELKFCIPIASVYLYLIS